jgi:hypothetical protein
MPEEEKISFIENDDDKSSQINGEVPQISNLESEIIDLNSKIYNS